ncbi:response regulator transcription factor [Streptomyces sp. NPDC047072]|uniref:response regulator transcription factor n=1 Tax=Streptomyces sp. NPDC047072 TaxID=3154809 RepID=UPI00340D1E85
MDPIRVLIAEDEPVARMGIRVWLEESGIEVVAEADTGSKAVELAQAHRVDVVIMDLNMPDQDGIAATREIRRTRPGSKILAFTSFSDVRHLRAAVRAGVHGFILKDRESEDLVRAVRALANRETHFGRGTAHHVVALFQEIPEQPCPLSLQGLNARQLSILALLVDGHEYAAGVARELSVSEKTVRSRVSEAKEITGARTLEELTELARHAGFGSPFPRRTGSGTSSLGATADSPR